MIKGIGTDLLSPSRIARLSERYGAALAEKILTAAERAALEGLSPQRATNRIAKSFAAKEAFVKALGTGFNGVSYQDVGVSRSPLGAPQLVFSATMQAQLAERGVSQAHLTLTDQDDLILAFVVLEGR